MGFAPETAVFFYACALGAGLGVLYDVFRLLRLVTGGKALLVFLVGRTTKSAAKQRPPPNGGRERQSHFPWAYCNINGVRFYRINPFWKCA